MVLGYLGGNSQHTYTQSTSLVAVVEFTTQQPDLASETAAIATRAATPAGTPENTGR